MHVLVPVPCVPDLDTRCAVPMNLAFPKPLEKPFPENEIPTRTLSNAQTAESNLAAYGRFRETHRNSGCFARVHTARIYDVEGGHCWSFLVAVCVARV